VYNSIAKRELEELTGDTIDDINNSILPITSFVADSTVYEDGIFWYSGNHLSSTMLVTNLQGAINQAVMYCPFGQIISEYRQDWMLDTIPRYLFSAKELDEESGMYYFVARYYDPSKMTFISRDPHFEKYFYLSSYSYCANSPLNVIDPNGKDIYQVDENGNSVGRIKNKNFDQFQVVTVNKDGSKTVTASSQEYKYGTVMGQMTNIAGKGTDGKPVNIDIYAIKGSKEGESIHQFFSKNTKVEFGRWDFKSGMNLIGTSHKTREEGSAAVIKDFLSLYKNAFKNVNMYDHNHPAGTTYPSGLRPGDKDGDVSFIKSIEDANPNATFRIYTKDKGYFYYNSFGPSAAPCGVEAQRK
jgi:RHS repeat-associated protein